jgi:hypothetical protein
MSVPLLLPTFYHANGLPYTGSCRILKDMKLARLHHLADVEPYWHVQLTVVVAIFLQLILSGKLTIGPKYAIAGLELLLLLALALFASGKHRTVRHLRRGLAIVLIAIISLANISSLALIIKELLGTRAISGKELLVSGLAIYLTNIIIFGLWYWELDSNGSETQDVHTPPVDFLFPQMTAATTTHNKSWNPTFFDYLYVSVTNASAFSPTDTMPLTHRAKLLMTLQSLTSLVTIALVAARAVNILA